MNKYNKYIACATALSTMLVLQNVSQTSAATINSPSKIDRTGLMSYYFSKQNFKDILFFSKTSGEHLNPDMGKIGKAFDQQVPKCKSIIWKGQYISQKDGEYHFSVNNSYKKNINIVIDNELVYQNGKSLKKITFKKGESLPIEIFYNSETEIRADYLESLSLTLFNSTENNTIKGSQFRTKQDPINKKSQSSQPFYGGDSLDTDGDAIPDVMEKNGYTIEGQLAVPWNDTLASQGYKKYVSNPYNSHTAHDPYTDFEKAAHQIDLSSDSSTFNPLVSANPLVTVSLENLILSPNQNLTNSVSSTQSTGWSSSRTWGIGTTATASLDPSVSVSRNYSHTTTTTNDWGVTQGNTSEFNSASAAYLNANVRYYNTGTGTIYSAKPTTNFVLGNSTVATIQAQGNTTALSLGAGESYPKQGQHGIAINTMDNFNSQPISLNSDQFNMLLDNEAPLSIETPQTDGNFMRYDDNGNLTNGGSWSGYEEQIKNTTAAFIMDTGDDVSERNIAAKNFDDPEDLTPVLNVEDALHLAYPKESFTEKKGALPDSTPITYFNGHPFVNEAFIGSVDSATNGMLEEQENSTSPEFSDVKTLFDVKLMPKMNFTFKLPMYYNVASDNNIYSGTDTLPEHHPGNWNNTHVKKDSTAMGGYSFSNTFDANPVMVFPKDITDKLYASNGSAFGTYVISFYVKAASDDHVEDYNSDPMVTINNFNHNTVMAFKEIKLSDHYQRVNLLVYNGADNDYISSIHIHTGVHKIDWNSVSINKISGLDLTK